MCVIRLLSFSGTTTSSTSVTAVTASTEVISKSSSSSVRQYQGGAEAPTSGEQTGNASDRKTGQATPGNYVVNDDDYTLWAEFSERDF